MRGLHANLGHVLQLPRRTPSPPIEHMATGTIRARAQLPE